MSAKTNLLEAAADLARSDGVTALGVERVIHKAGVSKGAFFYHFANKDEMVRALLDHVSEGCMSRVNEAVARGERFTDAFVDMVISEVRDSGALIAVLVASVSLDPTLRETLTERRQAVRRRMIEEDGVPSDRATLLCLAIDGAMIGTVLYREGSGIDQVKKIAASLRHLLPE
ncbi:MAG: TetR/AcrR family transcriptional regulator [Cohaesibacteraceae bacterium]|mgnify:CR=1 FL=1